MTKKELDRGEALAKLTSGELQSSVAASRLGISKRQLRRLRRRYESDGIEGLCHRSRCKPSGRSMQPEVLRKATKLLRDQYHDFGPTLAAEKLRDWHKISISREKTRQLLIKEGLWQPKKKRNRSYHPRRPRRSREGELVQIDGSDHGWLEGRAERFTLIIFVDDATSKIQLARFVEAETTRNYMLLSKEYIEQYGCPQGFYSDKHSIFRQNNPEVRERGVLTNFGVSLKEAGIELICANSPQAKGRVERAFGTLQDRLSKELRLADVCSMEEANAFLLGFIKDYNIRFSVDAKLGENAHRPAPKCDLNLVFSFRETRRLSRNLSFQYRNTLYQVDHQEERNRLSRTQVRIKETLDERIVVENEKGRQLNFSPYSEYLGPVQATLDVKDLATLWADRKPNRPARNHPWR